MDKARYLSRKIRSKFLPGPKGVGDAFCKIYGDVIHPNAKVKIGFYLGDSLLTHLGDQLFFEPAIRLCCESRSVMVFPTPGMSDYFSRLGITVVSESELFACDLVVTRRELLPDVIGKARTII